MDKVYQHASKGKIQSQQSEWYINKSTATRARTANNPKWKKGVSPNHSRLWEGPYLVKDRKNDVLHRIQQDPNSKPKIVHHNRFWTYSGNKLPSMNTPHSAPFLSRPGASSSVEQHGQKKEASQEPHHAAREEKMPQTMSA